MKSPLKDLSHKKKISDKSTYIGRQVNIIIREMVAEI